MGCNCRKVSNVTSKQSPEAIVEAREIGLKQCYECAKKHLSRAKEEFKEYHTGYPQHIKNLIQSIRVAEDDVREAFLKWNEVQAQLDMSAGELLGRGANADRICHEHLQLANDIRLERLKFSGDVHYIPDFDNLLVRIQVLEYETLD